MATSNRNFVLFYIVLVGLPILGLFGVLRKGRSLTPPLSVDGSWKVQPDSLASLPCGNSSQPSNVNLAIAQSGQTFTMDLGGAQKSPIFGALEGTTLKATGPSSAWPGDNSCASGHDFSLIATVDPKANPRALAGTISINDCASCSPVSFHAVRQVPAEKGAH
jgi:hypothetical protein